MYILKSSSKPPQSSDLKTRKIKPKSRGVFYQKIISERKKWNLDKPKAKAIQKRAV